MKAHYLQCISVPLSPATPLAVATYRVVLRGADQHVFLALDRPNRSLVRKEGALTLPRLQVPNLTLQVGSG